MASEVEDYIEHLRPYVPGKPIEELERELGIEGSIKLASNENPLGPPRAAIEAIESAASEVHLYPDGAAYTLKSALADHVDVRRDELVCGNGSNEVLTLIVRTFCVAGRDHAVMPAFSFIAYRLIAQAAGLDYTQAPLGEGYRPDVDSLLEAIEDRTRILFVANPNNPTGTYLPHDELCRLLDAVPEEIVVVLDEAYDEYARADDYTSALELRERHERLFVLHTFSKCYGLAGMRVGYGVGPASLVDYVNRVREPFNVNRVAQKAAVAALAERGFVERAVSLNEESRAVLVDGLEELADRGVSYTPSQTNFVLVHTEVAGPALYNQMLRRGVIVRPMAGYGLPRAVRISLGTPGQMERCLGALRDSLDELP